MIWVFIFLQIGYITQWKLGGMVALLGRITLTSSDLGSGVSRMSLAESSPVPPSDCLV